MGHHDAFDWLSLGAAYIGVLGLTGGIIRYWGQSRDKRREQALRVFAWYGDGDERSNVTVRNLSDQPIFGVVLHATKADGKRGGLAIGMLDAATDKRVPYTDSEGRPTVPPQVLGIKFRDASGRFWYRSPTGKLYRWRGWGKLKYELVWWRERRAVKTRMALEPHGAAGDA